MHLLCSLSHKEQKIIKICTKKHLWTILGWKCFFWKRIHFEIFHESVTFYKYIILQYISKYSLCQNLTFQKEKKEKWKKNTRRHFLNVWSQKKLLWTVIFCLYTDFDKWWHKLFVFMSFFDPGLQYLNLGFKTAHLK